MRSNFDGDFSDYTDFSEYDPDEYEEVGSSEPVKKKPKPNIAA